MPLEDYSLEELYSELQRRIGSAERVPQPLSNPNWAELVIKCEEVIDFYGADLRIEPPEYYTALAEKTLEIVYGPSIWTWFRQRYLRYLNRSQVPKGFKP